MLSLSMLETEKPQGATQVRNEVLWVGCWILFSQTMVLWLSGL